MRSCAHATGLPLPPVVCLLVTMGMDMNEWLIAWIMLLKAVRAVCAPKCLEKDEHADFLCLHCYPNAVGDNTWAYFMPDIPKIPRCRRSLAFVAAASAALKLQGKYPEVH